MKITLNELRRIIKEEIEVLSEMSEPKPPPIEGPQYPGKFPGQVAKFTGVSTETRKYIPIIDKFTGLKKTIPIKVNVKNDIVFVWNGTEWTKLDTSDSPESTDVSTTTKLMAPRRERPERPEPPIDPRGLGTATVIRRRRRDDGEEEIMPIRK